MSRPCAHAKVVNFPYMHYENEWSSAADYCNDSSVDNYYNACQSSHIS